MVYDSARACLSGLIDYAGLFPPAELPMNAAVGNFLQYSKGDHAWVLGRFVTPAAQIGAMSAAAAGQAISATALLTSATDAEIAAVVQANIDTVELKAGTPAQIRTAAERLPSGLTCYFEIPSAQDPRECVRAIADAGARAKVRTGGPTEDAFPGSRNLARFMHACVDANVPFKATAGLHYPLRGSHPVAGPGSAEVVKHGFLNLFLAAAFLRAGMELGQAVRLLEDQTAKPFAFTEDGVNWRDESLDTDQIEDARKHVGIAFGSCSFEEPIAELKRLKIL
jgi:hypothetical protein